MLTSSVCPWKTAGVPFLVPPRGTIDLIPPSGADVIDNVETFPQALKRLREVRKMSVRDLAVRARMSKSKVARLETAECGDGRNVSPEDAAVLDLVLESGITLVTAAERDRLAAMPQATRALLTGPNRYTDLAANLVHAGISPRGVDPVDRRAFLSALTLPAIALEMTRHGMGLAMTSRADLAVEEWQEIVQEHGFSYMTMPPHDMLQALMVDMVAIQYATPDTHGPKARELQRLAAMLSALTAMTVSNLGQLREGHRWWRTARTMADQSGDPYVRTWVRGREVVRALYEQRPPEMVIAMAERYEQEIEVLPPAALPELLGGKAQAFAMAGRDREAADCLPQLQQVCADLPADVLAQGASVFGWSDDRLLFTRSFVYSFNGNFDEACAAQDAAIAVYPPSYRRGPAQIELQRSMCLAQVGDSDQAARNARTVIEQLPAADHIRPIADLSQRVLSAIPAADTNRPEVRSYRELLSTPRQIASQA